MKIKFLAKGSAPKSYGINNAVISGVDVSAFPEGGNYIGNTETLSAGIYNVERINGELHVTLSQRGLAYECQPDNGSHDWSGSDEWIDAADYDPDRCYIVATSAPEGAEYVKRDNGWTVVVPQPNEEPTQ